MNLLITSNRFTDVTQAIFHLLQRYRPDHCYMVFEGDYNKQIPYDFDQVYSRLSVMNGEYSTYIFAKECPPLEEEVILQMRRYEPFIIKMMERQEELQMYLCHKPIWQLMEKRQGMDYDSRVRLYYRHLRYWNYMLDKAEIDAVVMAQIPHGIYDTLIYFLCKEKNIKVTTSNYLPMYGTYFFSDIYDSAPRSFSRFAELKKQYADCPLESIELPEHLQHMFTLLSEAKEDRTPYYMKNGPIYKEPVVADRFVKNLLKKGPAHLFRAIRFRLEPYWKPYFRRKLSRSLFKAYDRLVKPVDYNTPYIYFALHFQPECTSNPMGGIFVDQLLAIQMLSRYLPENTKIYVKENPWQTNFCRDENLYYDLVETRGVQLVPRDTDTYQLLEHCVAVSSITGTVGMEGLMIGKPFLMFGHNLYTYSPGTFNIRNNEDCKNAMEYIFTHGAKHTLKDMRLYFKILGEIVRPCSVGMVVAHMLGLNPEENAAILADGYSAVLDSQLDWPRYSN